MKKSFVFSNDVGNGDFFGTNSVKFKKEIIAALYLL